MNLKNKFIQLSIFQRFLVVFLIIRVVVACFSSFLPLDNPHLWRQTDTMGVAMRYWQRWSHENNFNFNLFLPAVLNSGDHYGITPMEFPFLNILSAPFFYFGPALGVKLSHFFLSIILSIFILINLNIWKKINIYGISAYEMILLLPMFSYAKAIAWHFMPDFFSLLLCLTALGLSWRIGKEKFVYSFLLTSLGLLIKPTTVAVFLMLFAHEQVRKKLSSLLWILPSVFLTGLYYTVGIKYIESKQDIAQLFAVDRRPIFKSLKEFFIDYSSLWDNLNFHAFVPYAFLIFLLLSFYKKAYLRLWLIVLSQFIIIAALDGKHAYIHYYYFISLTIGLSLIAIGVWHKNKNILLRFAIFALFIGCYVDIIHYNIRSLTRIIHGDSPFFQCEALKKRHPEFPWQKNEVFTSWPENYPSLGLCFGEREGSLKNYYGFASVGSELPVGCKIIDKEGHFSLLNCGYLKEK